MSSAALSLIGILIAVAVLIYLSFKKVSLIVLEPIVSVIVLVFSKESIMAGLTGPYATSFGNFAKNNFLLFLPGILLGELLEESGAARDIAYGIAKVVLKAKGNVKFWGMMGLSLIAAILSFGGVSGFVIVFTMAPICKELFKKLDIPWHFVIGVLVYGGGMWTAILPGSPAVQNLMPMSFLKTKATAAPMIGISIALLSILQGGLYLYYTLRKTEKKKEGFLPTGEKIEKAWLNQENKKEEPGSIVKALIPSFVLIVAMNVFNVLPEASLALGVLTGALLYLKKVPNWINLLKKSGEKTATTLMNICAVVGFGGVVAHVSGFTFLVDSLGKLPGPPLVQLALATNVIAGITGSASGGEGIVLQTLVPKYVALGIRPDIIHRIVNISCYGLDSMPHNGTTNTRLNYSFLTHKEAYYHEFFIGALFPFFNSFIAVWLAYLGFH